MEGRSMRRLMYSYEDGYTTEYEEYEVKDGEIVVNMGSHSALVVNAGVLRGRCALSGAVCGYPGPLGEQARGIRDCKI